jgi:asparagine synthase (glutamine-hydrolysing)
MCGFVGYLLPDGTPHPDVAAWGGVIDHRGPDQAGHAVDNGFGIATRRLSIQDLSEAGSQPMRTERYLVGFNGEIYNHLDLRRELQAEFALGFVSHSDTETILRGIECWGIHETLRRLNGMYALAIWDTYTRELVLARDPLGIKPICYVQRGGELYFASEAKALRRYTSGQVSRDGLALFLYFGFVPAPFSLLEGVQKVRPGEMLVVGPAGTTRAPIVPRAWSEPKPLALHPEERLAQVRVEVQAAVQRQLLSDVSVGLFLSGGVDSTIVAATAAAAQPDLSSFSLKPTETSADPGAQRDAELAAELARALGIRHHEVVFTPRDIAAELDHLLNWMDEPIAEPYAAAELLLSRRARAEGITVVLTGHGADEVFLGYPTYQAAMRGDLYNKMPMLGPALRLATHVPWFSHDTRTNLRGTASVWRKSPMERYTIVSGVHFALDDAAVVAGLPVPHVRGLVQSIFEQTRAFVSQLPRADELESVELFSRMDMLLMVPEHYNTRLDRASMGASVEARVPLQDLELIGFTTQLTRDELLQGGLKGMLKRAFADVLPEAVTERPKQTFQAPLLSWVSGPLAPWVTAQLAASSISLPGNGRVPGHPPATAREAYRQWSLALLEGWRTALALEY